MTVNAFFTVVPKPDAGEALQAYSEKAGPMLVAAGGTNGRRVKIGDAIVGENPGFAMAMMMDFPSPRSIGRSLHIRCLLGGFTPPRSRIRILHLYRGGASVVGRKVQFPSKRYSPQKRGEYPCKTLIFWV